MYVCVYMYMRAHTHARIHIVYTYIHTFEKGVRSSNHPQLCVEFETNMRGLGSDHGPGCRWMAHCPSVLPSVVEGRRWGGTLGNLEKLLFSALQTRRHFHGEQFSP